MFFQRIVHNHSMFSVRAQRKAILIGNFGSQAVGSSCKRAERVRIGDGRCQALG